MSTKDKIWLSTPHMGEEEFKFVQEAFETNWISPVGPFLGQLEQELANYNKVEEVAVLSSGTAGIHLALILLGVGTGDEVMCSSFTFAASANPIVYVGAEPVFIDSEKETWNMDPEVLKEALRERAALNKLPKAIIVVHLYGMPAKMNEILAVADEYGIPVIEDAAESLGSSIDGQMTGSFGAMSILSFNGNKIITTSGGGALLSNNKSWIKQARFLSTQARDDAPHYQHSQIGYNYRMSNVCAGIGLGQLRVLDNRIEQKRAIYARYESEFREFEGVRFLDEPEGYFSNRWLSCILLDDEKQRETLRLVLAADNIESRPLWKPMHLQPVFASTSFYGEGVCEELFQHGLCLPSGTNMSEADMNRVIEIAKKTL